MAISPACTVNSGSTPADVAASSTVNGALANTTGVEYWSLSVISTDDTNTVAAVAATLTVNQTAKTFSFTAPGLGSAVILQSVVGVKGLGLDANGVFQSSFVTTFKVNVLTSNGFRVFAANEGSEQDPTFGWTKIVNAVIRAAT
jgi:hypothetical protein